MEQIISVTMEETVELNRKPTGMNHQVGVGDSSQMCMSSQLLSFVFKKDFFSINYVCISTFGTYKQVTGIVLTLLGFMIHRKLPKPFNMLKDYDVVSTGILLPGNQSSEKE